jgi:hypothetical protein
VLLGRAPDAALAVPAARAPASPAARRRVAAAGGALLTAASRFRGVKAPGAAVTPGTSAATDRLRERLLACTETDADGNRELRVTLPGPEALDDLARTLARLLQGAPTKE